MLYLKYELALFGLHVNFWILSIHVHTIHVHIKTVIFVYFPRVLLGTHPSVNACRLLRNWSTRCTRTKNTSMTTSRLPVEHSITAWIKLINEPHNK